MLDKIKDGYILVSDWFPFGGSCCSQFLSPSQHLTAKTVSLNQPVQPISKLFADLSFKYHLKIAWFSSILWQMVALASSTVPSTCSLRSFSRGPAAHWEGVPLSQTINLGKNHSWRYSFTANADCTWSLIFISRLLTDPGSGIMHSVCLTVIKCELGFCLVL